MTLDPRDALLAGGLEAPGGSRQPPVTHFTGRMVGFEVTTITPDGRDPYTLVTHKVNELKVLEKKEPFDFDSIEFSMSPSGKQRSLWGVWIASIVKATGAVIEESRPDDTKMRYQELYATYLDGKIVEIKRTNVHKLPRKNEANKWEDTLVESWELVSVEGAGSTISSEELALGLLTASPNKLSFIQAVASNPMISADKALLSTINDGSWITNMVNTGKVVAAGEGYTKI